MLNTADHSSYYNGVSVHGKPFGETRDDFGGWRFLLYFFNINTNSLTQLVKETFSYVDISFSLYAFTDVKKRALLITSFLSGTPFFFIISNQKGSLSSHKPECGSWLWKPLLRHCCCRELKANQLFVSQHVYLCFSATQNSIWFSFTIFYRAVFKLLILRLKPKFNQTMLNSIFLPAVPWLNAI